jgi:hypothetical protein
MTEDDITKKLDELISSITTRNQTVQEKKADGSPWAIISAVVLALVSLIGIGVAMYFANKKAKELAQAKTELEQQKVDLSQAAHDAADKDLQGKEKLLLEQLRVQAEAIHARDENLRKLEADHDIRKKQLDGLKAWEAINAA